MLLATIYDWIYCKKTDHVYEKVEERNNKSEKRKMFSVVTLHITNKIREQDTYTYHNDYPFFLMLHAKIIMGLFSFSQWILHLFHTQVSWCLHWNLDSGFFFPFPFPFSPTQNYSYTHLTKISSGGPGGHLKAILFIIAFAKYPHEIEMTTIIIHKRHRLYIIFKTYIWIYDHMTWNYVSLFFSDKA